MTDSATDLPPGERASAAFVKTTTERWGYRLRTTAAGSDLLDGLPSPTEIRGRPEPPVKRSRSSTVHAVRLPDGAALYYKLDHARGPADFLKNLLRPSRSLRAWRNLARLRDQGVMAPEPVACGERRVLGALLGSFLVTRGVDGEALRDAVPPASDTASLLRRRQLSDLLADLVADLHGRGIDHGDLNPRNLILATGDPERLWLLDADRTRFLRQPVPWRRRRRALAQLNACFDATATLADRARFLARYDPRFRALPREVRRSLWREIAELTRRRWQDYLSEGGLVARRPVNGDRTPPRPRRPARAGRR